MALCEFHYFSAALNKQTAANVILPETGEPPYPVMYLLHGLSDDYTIWLRRTSIERYVQDVPLIVVMPDGGRGFYSNARQGYAYDTAIAVELTDRMDRTFPTLAKREGRCLTGLSMGGYGALRLALTHSERFCSAVSHSGALGFGHGWGENDRYRNDEFARIIGPDPEGGPDDLYTLAAKVAPSRRPALRFDCGVEDRLIGDNRAFHAFLDSVNIAHEYEEFPGAHEWGYWDRHVQEAIAFHRRTLGI